MEWFDNAQLHLLAFALLVGASLARFVWCKCQGNFHQQTNAMGAGLISGVCILCLGYIFFIHKVGPNQMFVRQGDVLSVFPTEKWLWRWDARFYPNATIKGGAAVSYASRHLSEAVTVNPITVNPKVRPVHVVVELGFAGTPPAYLAYEQAIGVDQEQLWTRSQLYEFVEENSRWLGEHATNPFDLAQQTQFEARVRQHLEPRLPEGSLFLRGRFYFEESERSLVLSLDVPG